MLESLDFTRKNYKNGFINIYIVLSPVDKMIMDLWGKNWGKMWGIKLSTQCRSGIGCFCC